MINIFTSLAGKITKDRTFLIKKQKPKVKKEDIKQEDMKSCLT